MESRCIWCGSVIEGVRVAGSTYRPIFRSKDGRLHCGTRTLKERAKKLERIEPATQPIAVAEIQSIEPPRSDGKSGGRPTW
jgi:hypothetical protein